MKKWLSGMGLGLAWAVMGLMTPPALKAETFTWTNSAGGAFDGAGNWKTNNVTAVVAPGTNDAAFFTLGSATRATVTFSSSPAITNTTTNLSLWKDNADNKYEFAIADGGGSAVYDAGFTLFGGNWRYRADLLVSTGTLVSSQVTIEGYDALVTIVLDGPGTLWRIKDFFCTQQATLNVTIRNGAKLEALARNGGLNAKGGTVHRIDLDNLDANRALISRFRVTGAGSSAVFTNANASFNSNCETLMEFLDGAYGYFSNLTIGCSDTNYTPRLVVSNATLETAAFTFASVGSTRTFGTLLLKAGATMTSKGVVYLDSYSVKAVTATVDNATWTFSGADLWVGRSGQNMLVITNGGVMSGTNASASIPYTTGGSIATPNQVVVTGPGSRLELRSIYPGGASGYDRYSPGLLFVSDGGAVVQGNPAADLFIVWSNGLVNLSGGTITNASKMRVRGRLEGTGFISGNVHAEAAYSVVSPGNPIGPLAMGGTYTQSVGKLEIQINGTTPGAGYDVLAVTGNVWLAGGSVAVSTMPAFTLPAGLSTFDIVTTAGTLSTNGVTVSLPVDAAAWSARIVATAGGQALRVTARKPAAGTLIQVR